MKRIKLRYGKYAIVDEELYETLRKFKWYAVQNPKTGKWYAVRYEHGKGISMHRQLLRAPRSKQVDHVNGNGLDNRRSNLRLATSAQNAQNRDKYKTNTTGYKGVSQQKGRRKFRAQIYANRKAIYLGWYDTAQEAALAYDRAVPIYHEEFGCTNF
jgi:hypothetical protein